MNVVTTWKLISDSNRTNDAVFLIDLQSRAFRYVNDCACHKLGYSREELLQMRVSDIDPLVDEVAFQKIDEEIKTQGYYLLETCHRTKDGRLFPVEISGHPFEYNGEWVGISIARDITERKYAEAEKQRLIDMLEESADFIGSANMQSKLLYHNRAAKRMVGLPDDTNLSELTISDMHPKWVLKLMQETAIPHVLSHGVWRGEAALLHREGYEIPVFQTLVLHHDRKGRPEFISTIMQNISERKQKDNQLALLDYAFDNVEEAIFLIDENARFVQVNEKACSSLGYTREELLTLRIFDIDPDFNFEHWEQYKAARLLGSPHKKIETRHKTKEGRIFPVEVRGTYFAHQGKNYNLSLVRDISERKETDRERRLLNYALNHVQESVWLIDHDAKIHYVNQKACHETGLAREKLLTLTIPDVDPDFPLERWSEHWQALKAKGAITLESSLKTKNGQISPIEVNASYFEFDGESYNLAFSRDISERKATERQLALLNYALDHVGEAAWLIDENAKFHYNNAEACRAIGYTREELLELGVPDIDPLYQLDFWPEHWQDLKTHSSLFFESRHQTKEGRIFPVEINANYFEFDGKGYNLALIRDITERKAAEKQFTLLDYALNHVQESVTLVDENSKIHYCNTEAYRTLGYTHEEMLQLGVFDIDPDYQLDIWSEHWQVLKENGSLIFESRHKTKDGHIFPVEVSANYFEFDGKGYNLGLVHDITERKKIQEDLQRSESLLSDAQRIAHIGSWEVDFSNGELIWTDENYRIWEIDKSQFGATVEAFYDTVHPEDLEKVAKAYKESVANKTLYQIEHRLLFPDGRIKYIAERGEPFCNEKGDIIRFVGTSMDITEQQRVKDILEFIAQHGWKDSGESFLVTLAQYLSQILGIDYVIIGKLGVPVTQAETAVFYAKGEILPNIQYDLKDSPCGNVMNGKICCYSENIQQIFPDDMFFVEMQIESYAGIPLLDTTGKVIGLIALMGSKPFIDTVSITSILQLVATSVAAELERQRSEQILRQSEQQFRVLAETLPSPVFRFDKECRRIYMNPVAEKISGIAAEELLYKKASDSSPLNKDELEKVEQAIQRVLETGKPQEGDVLFKVHASGQIYHFHNNYAPEFDANGDVASVICISHDITERKKMEEKLRQREQEFRILVETSPSPIIRYDADCRRIYVNPAVEKMAGKTAPNMLSRVPTDGTLLSDPIKNSVEQTLRHVLATGQATENEVELILADGQTHYFYNRYAPELDANGKTVGVVLIGHDITERKQMEQQMFYHASYDSLTGLPNRRMLNNRMREEISKAERGHASLTILFIDLDRFKEVNDTLGHEIGDCLLVEATQRIRSCIRTSDTVGRLGGDEFIVILPCAGDVPSLERVTQSILTALAAPFYFGYEYSAYISASIGIAVYPQDATDAESLIGCADQAMYAAKESGRNNFNFFTASMQEQAQQRLRLIGCLREALEKNQFEVYYQPITCVVSGKAVKAEALVRWHHPVLGMVSPAIFIPLAEETDLIQDIGSWVFRQAADTAKRWNELNEDDEHRLISINMSPRQLIKGTGDQIAINYLQEIELDSAHIVIEITEGLLLDDSPDIIDKLNRLRAAGIQISLDDFGTGYSAMAYLKKFNLDYLKIDQSFVRGMETDIGDHAITDAIIMMAHRLGMKVIAEGVETDGQLKLLTEAGCEYIQGYFYSKPLPIDAFLSYVMR